MIRLFALFFLLAGGAHARSHPDAKQAAADEEVLFVIGGEQFEEATANVQVIDFSGQALPCRQPASLPNPNDQEFAFTKEDGSLTVCGGISKGKQCLDYDPIANEWNTSPFSLSNPRNDGAVVKLEDGRVWLLGGRGNDPTVSEIYTNGDIVDGPNLPEDMIGECAALVAGTQAFISSSESGRAYLVDADGAEPIRLPNLPIDLVNPACGAAPSPNGGVDIIVVGGFDGAQTSSTSYILNTGAALWRPGPAYPHPIQDTMAVPFGDSFVVPGGSDGAGGYTTDIWQYDAAGESWVARPETIATDYAFASFVFASADAAPCSATTTEAATTSTTTVSTTTSTTTVSTTTSQATSTSTAADTTTGAAASTTTEAATTTA